jgi:hypothetical protein
MSDPESGELPVAEDHERFVVQALACLDILQLPKGRTTYLLISPQDGTRWHGHEKAQKAQKQGFIESFVTFSGL